MGCGASNISKCFCLATAGSSGTGSTRQILLPPYPADGYYTRSAVPTVTTLWLVTGKKKGSNISLTDNCGLGKMYIFYYLKNKRGQGKTTT